MANNSAVTQEVLQNTLERYHENFVYPYLNGATHTGCVPLGTILPYFGETAPTHFLICDGTEYAKADYPELAEHLLALTNPTPYVGSDSDHFKVPDLRGEFLRGSGTNGHANQGNGANVGVHQNSTSLPDYGVLNNGQYVYKLSNAYGINNPDKVIKRDILGWYLNSNLSGSSTPDVNVLMNVRPTNTSVTYIIAYRNAYIDLALDSFPIDISNPTDGQALVWNGTEGRWKNAGILHEYSTDEKVVGTWIDGKPIYEKTIVIQSNFEDTIVVDSNIDMVINVRAFRDYTNANSIFPYMPIRENVYNDYLFSGHFSKTDKTWHPYIGPGVASSTTALYYTFQYTKTTD